MLETASHSGHWFTCSLLNDVTEHRIGHNASTTSTPNMIALIQRSKFRVRVKVTANFSDLI